MSVLFKLNQLLLIVVCCHGVVQAQKNSKSKPIKGATCESLEVRFDTNEISFRSKRNGDICYFVVEQALNWTSAAKRCNDFVFEFGGNSDIGHQHGRLAFVEKQSTLNWIADNLLEMKRTDNNRLWSVGLFQNDTSGRADEHWFWMASNGAKSQVKPAPKNVPWFRSNGNPNGRGEECGFIFLSGGKYGLADYRCSENEYFKNPIFPVCEVKLHDIRYFN